MAAPITFRKGSSCLSFTKQFLCYRFCVRDKRLFCMSSNTKGTAHGEDNNPFPLYASHEVQKILRRITGFDLMKVAGPKKVSLERPIYKLLTDAELSQEQESARTRLSEHLDNPPPYMNPRQRFTEPLAVDPDLAHFDTHPFVFSDISFGVKDRERSVVIREIDGTLRVAPWDVKERMNQIYNPREGRSIIKPKMFEEEHLERLISEKKYVYILERACAQFEPDDPDFLRVSHRIYSAVNSSSQFDILRSTRFFAPLVFHLVWNKMVDLLLIDLLSKDLETDITDLVSLYCMVHPNGACAQAMGNDSVRSPESIVKIFLETEATMQSEIELALQSMMDRRRMGEGTSILS